MNQKQDEAPGFMSEGILLVIKVLSVILELLKMSKLLNKNAGRNAWINQRMTQNSK